MGDALNRMIESWILSGVEVNGGASEREMQEFEEGNEVKLPTDLKEYFRRINGMPPNMWDDNMVDFMSISEVHSIYEEMKSNLPSRRAVLEKVDSPDKFFIFANYLSCSHLYAIYLDGEVLKANPVIWVDVDKCIEIASSFTEFVELYVSQPDVALFPF